MKEIKPDKGLFNGSCNRRDCQKPGAKHYNESTRAYYCAECAERINRWSRVDVGRDICVEVKSPELLLLESIAEQFTDRTPSAASKLRMSRETADALMAQLNAENVTGRSAPVFGVEIHFDPDLAFGEWEEWDGDRWHMAPIR